MNTPSPLIIQFSAQLLRKHLTTTHPLYNQFSSQQRIEHAQGIEGGRLNGVDDQDDLENDLFTKSTSKTKRVLLLFNLVSSA